MSGGGPFRDERDATIEKLRDELRVTTERADVAEASASKLARMASSKRNEPAPLPFSVRWWALPLRLLAAALLVPGTACLLIAMAVGLHALFLYLGGTDNDRGGAWVLAGMITVFAGGASILVTVQAYFSWAEKRQRALEERR